MFLVGYVEPLLKCVTAIVTLDAAIFQPPLPLARYAFIRCALIETDETRTTMHQSHLPVTMYMRVAPLHTLHVQAVSGSI